MHRLMVFVAALAGATGAEAHDAAGSTGASQFEFWLAGLLLAGAVLYARGIFRLWRKAGVGRGIRRLEFAGFALGWIALAVALLSPIDTVAEHSFAIHMIQHELLMVVAAPLIVLGRPLETLAWGVPASVGRAAAAVARNPWPDRPGPGEAGAEPRQRGVSGACPAET